MTSRPPVALAVLLAVFVPYAVLVMQPPLQCDCLWATLCLCGTVHFIFRS